ncbi:MAG: hypothetical protein RMK84_09380 [Oscillochloridaceae bacterium]|nr:hypothetical protein [Chloroflexaceae bacterium]MDW8390325.1 hypothetical protein [Oscillochloridaceae bacterium]
MARASIVYVGTTEGLAIYSDPGGTGRWRRVGRVLEGQAIRGLLAADALNLVAAVDDGPPLRTSDGGQSWALADAADAERLLALLRSPGPLVYTAQGPAQWRGAASPDPEANALALLAGKQETLIAARAGGSILARSEDGGATWSVSTVEGGLDGRVQTLAPASYHMDYIWAGTSAGQLLRSEDRGRTWQEAGREPAAITCIAALRIVGQG